VFGYLYQYQLYFNDAAQRARDIPTTAYRPTPHTSIKLMPVTH